MGIISHKIASAMVYKYLGWDKVAVAGAVSTITPKLPDPNKVKQPSGKTQFTPKKINLDPVKEPAAPEPLPTSTGLRNISAYSPAQPSVGIPPPSPAPVTIKNALDAAFDNVWRMVSHYE